MRKSVLLISSAILLLTCVPMVAMAYQYISPEDVKQGIGNKAAMTLVDIQVEKEFDQHHIQGALATYAYPVKSATDRAKLDSAVSALKNNSDKVVVICPRGAGGAKRAYDYLQSAGIPEERLFILTKGQAGWPYPELLDPTH